MSDFVKTYSTSVKLDLEKTFEFNTEYIKNFISCDLMSYLQENAELKNNLKNLHELKSFIGKKRKASNQILITEEEDDEKYQKYFIETPSYINESKECISAVNIPTKGYILRKEKLEIGIFDKPIVFTEIYDTQTININLINDTTTFVNTTNTIKKYNYQIYFLDNENKLRDCIGLKEINDTKNTIKSYEIENETINPFLILLKSKIPEIKDSDLKLENIFPNKSENGKIFPKNISKIFFYYFNIGTDLQEKYEYIESQKRKELYTIIESFIYFDINKIIIIAGPKGIGKTTSLIYISFIREYNIFYFNLESYQKYSEEYLKDIKKKN